MHAQKEAKRKKLAVVAIEKVSGAFEIPFLLKRVLARSDVDGVVVLGAIVQGETAHDELVAYTTAKQVQNLSLEFDKPVGYAVTGPRMTIEQAKQRAKKFSVHAVSAVARLLVK